MRRLFRFLLLSVVDDALPATNLIEKQRFRLFRITTLFAFIVFMVSMVQMYLAIPGFGFAVVSVTLLFAAIFFNYFIFAVHHRTRIAYTILVFLLFGLLHMVTYYSGGVRNSGMFLLTAIILTTYMLLGQRLGKIMAIISLLHVIYFYVLSMFPGTTSYAFIGSAPELIDLDFFVTGLISILVVTSQSAYLEKAKEAIVQDIIMRTREVRNKNVELKLKNRELEQFAYVASHDLQEPLRTISGFVEILHRQYGGKLDSNAEKYIGYVLQSSDRMKVLIKDLLDYSRIGMSKELVEVDCNEILNHVLIDLDYAIRMSGAEIHRGTLPVVKGYDTEIKQLFQNLLANAIKFRRKDISPVIHINAEMKDDIWNFSFMDNGIGIEPEHAERIFVIFQRLHTRTDYEGSGIGLSHCKKIVELHQGNIRVESTYGAGSNFIFTLHENTIE